MSWDISIGEKTISPEDGEIYVPEVRLDNAPSDGVPTDYTNHRWPSYSTWDDFLVDTELVEMMDGDSTSVIHITHGLLEMVRVADIKYKEKHKPGAPSNTYQYNIDRLDWLLFWLDWALKNCKEPIITMY